MSASLPWKAGETVVICGVSGQAFYASDCVRRYDGLVVAKRYCDPQHPQELRRARPERAAQPPLAPEPPDVFTDTFLDFIIVESAPENEMSFLLWEDNSMIGWG